MPTLTPAVPVRWSALRRSTRCCVVVFCTLLLTVGLEVGARMYWHLAKKVPLFQSERVWHAFYPEVDRSGVEAQAVMRGDETFDVLLLGGSVLTDYYGDVAERLQHRLHVRLGRAVRIFNLANVGMTSLDSRWKYGRLTAQRFDLVMAYEGINDVYMNNCPAEYFRDDYGHVPRCWQIMLLGRHPELAYLSFPYTLRYLASAGLDRNRLSTRPRRAWHHHGSVLKTPPAFAANLEAIIATAEERGDPLVLMTFAYHVAADYNETAFAAARLDYGRHVSPIEFWGTPENVSRCLDAHNAMTRRLAAEHGITLIDQQALLPKGATYFDDICHLAPAGCERFVDNILSRLALPR